MKNKNYTSFDISSLETKKISNNHFNVDRFKGYLEKNPHIQVTHKHSFYHMVFFTKGSGKHILDFETYDIKEGIIYFMKPNQVHKWEFDEHVDGYVLNFTSTFLEQFFINPEVIAQFPFFNIFESNQVIELDSDTQIRIKGLFEDIIKEVENLGFCTPLVLSTYLLQIFIFSSRQIQNPENIPTKNSHHKIILKKYLELIELHFKTVKLPKEYAKMLHITPAQLNAITHEQTHVSAGQLIRDRVLLEAKRLLVNFDLNSTSIALELDFHDTSYFIKFFKKQTGLTPEKFRKQYLSNG